MKPRSVAQAGQKLRLPCGCQISRRLFLGCAAGVAAHGLAVGREASAQPAPGAAPIQAIDVHHHFVPPAYLKMLPSPEPSLRTWTTAKDLEDLDASGTKMAILSVTAPGVWLGDVQQARSMSRVCNEYAATMMADHPGRYRLFAVLPMPDVEGSLREIEYALDVLKADGVGMFTSYDDAWLGNAKFNPVFEELNRRKAVVYTHPSFPQCCTNLLPSIKPRWPPSVVEFGTDTSRSIGSYLFSGSARRYPDVRMVFSHAGGTMPYLIGRFRTQDALPGADASLPPGGLMAALGRFYYDTAQASDPIAMGALKGVVPLSQILFGTDFPFRSTARDAEGVRTAGFTEPEIAAIYRENARRLMPQLPA